MTPLEFGQKILAEQPFSVLLGAELTELEIGRAELRLLLKDKHKQQHGFAHGGAVAYLADNALTYAGGSVLSNPITLEMKINYIRPGIGTALIARAEAVSSGKRQAVCECKAYALQEDGEEKLCAAALGTIMARD
ncbi:PaaI family thioesterase [Alisedimentitalea sp. MJ-SS2]|uniref:PaaI family thioesterase n=1 Tax=Aliisedimentitalea sp. MJ-SS2 TaxID=3049795 RepID=UPI00290D6534|nr:PaaI family thioesterase [Alisedimentitalea sp. MJ-SS2]MDU8928996.1 PaaI family thioesterase [Alisedimentitalea sp. MJ-SS2]